MPAIGSDLSWPDPDGPTLAWHVPTSLAARTWQVPATTRRGRWRGTVDANDVTRPAPSSPDGPPARSTWCAPTNGAPNPEATRAKLVGPIRSRGCVVRDDDLVSEALRDWRIRALARALGTEQSPPDDRAVHGRPVPAPDPGPPAGDHVPAASLESTVTRVDEADGTYEADEAEGDDRPAEPPMVVAEAAAVAARSPELATAAPSPARDAGQLSVVTGSADVMTRPAVGWTTPRPQDVTIYDPDDLPASGPHPILLADEPGDLGIGAGQIATNPRGMDLHEDAETDLYGGIVSLVDDVDDVDDLDHRADEPDDLDQRADELEHRIDDVDDRVDELDDRDYRIDEFDDDPGSLDYRIDEFDEPDDLDQRADELEDHDEVEGQDPPRAWEAAGAPVSAPPVEPRRVEPVPFPPAPVLPAAAEPPPAPLLPPPPDPTSPRLVPPYVDEPRTTGPRPVLRGAVRGAEHGDRRRFLAEVRQHLAGAQGLAAGGTISGPHPVTVPEPRYANLDLADLVGSFVQAVEAAGGTCHHVVGDLPDSLLDVLVSELDVWKTVVSGDEGVRELAQRLAHRGVEVAAPTPEDAMAAGMGLTSAVAGVAATGSLVLDSQRDRGRLAALLPPVHLCVLPIERLVATPSDVLRSLGQAPRPLPSSLMLLTGPSRGDDVEKLLTVGALGPAALHVVLLERRHEL